MRKTSVSTLALTLLVLGIAGIAWAGQTAVQAPEDPAAEAPTSDQAPEASLPAGEDQSPNGFNPEDLFQQPVEVDACCFADCFNQRSDCKAACPPFGDPGFEACHDACYAEYLECKSHC